MGEEYGSVKGVGIVFYDIVVESLKIVAFKQFFAWGPVRVAVGNVVG